MVYALNKPFGILSQFSSEGNHPGILSLQLNLPKDVWPIGRLDRDSEGLLLLTDDMRLRQQLTDPKENSRKTYWVQVEGAPTEETLERFQQPMLLRIKKQEIRTKPARVSVMDEPEVWDRTPPIRHRLSVPTSWIALELKEGKNRQVRRMTANVGHPTLRLIRAEVGDLTLKGLGLSPGEVIQLKPEQIAAARA
ncbi:MAG TPA: pseudouridine synthase [Flavobacteriales bacterium]|jgi:23S rRNA pseudouridine2457 synthase|nr:pseudouridine synthase [Flavobacteriales bacterium]